MPRLYCWRVLPLMCSCIWNQHGMYRSAFRADASIGQLFGYPTLWALNKVWGAVLCSIRGKQHNAPMPILPALLKHLRNVVHSWRVGFRFQSRSRVWSSRWDSLLVHLLQVFSMVGVQALDHLLLNSAGSGDSNDLSSRKSQSSHSPLEAPCWKE